MAAAEGAHCTESRGTLPAAMADSVGSASLGHPVVKA